MFALWHFKIQTKPPMFCTISPLPPHQQAFKPLSHWQLQCDKMRLFRVAPSLAQAGMKLGKTSN